MLQIISIPLGWIMSRIYEIVGNYGITLILFTIVTKLLMMPLTIKQKKSMIRMNAFQPLIQNIQKKYKDDPAKQNEELARLQNEHGFSMTSGCLPLVIQMPILFAMFRFFPASIELRQQKFLWADDLSAYDSIIDFGVNVPLLGDHLSLFALLMAVTMFFYSKMSSSQMSDDPNMAGMKFMSVWLMPIMMFFICNNLSAALSYYYLLSNIITMIMTWYIRKYVVTEEKVRNDMMLAAKQPKKKSKWQQRLEEAQKMQEQMQKNRR